MFNLLPTIFYHSAQLGEKPWGGKTGGKTGDTQKLPSIRLCRFRLMTLARNASVPVDSTVDSTRDHINRWKDERGQTLNDVYRASIEWGDAESDA